MDYSIIADAYSRLENTPKRLEMMDILAELFISTPKEDLAKVVYLSQGKIGPDFSGLELGLADKLALKAVAFTTGQPEIELEQKYLDMGDMGELAAWAISKKKQTALFSSALTLERVFNNFLAITEKSGGQSQKKKIQLIADLLHDASPIEARYMIRTVVGKLRLGTGTMTILEALCAAFVSREDKPVVERAYNVSSDLGMVAYILASQGLDGVEGIKLSLGVPLKPMLAERLGSVPDILEKLGECQFEYKYDGLRVQAHIRSADGGNDGNPNGDCPNGNCLDDGGSLVKLFSRQLEDITEQFPELHDSLLAAFKGKSAVVEGECVPVDPNTGEMLPFQVISQRRGRKRDLEKAVEEIPVKLYLFDCLALNGKDMTDSTLPERRRTLEDNFETSDMVALGRILVTDEPEKAQEFFDMVISEGGEGVMAKSIAEDSTYRAGGRGWQWIKYKRDYQADLVDTLDLVAVGAFRGKGRRSGWYGGLLMASYDPETDTYQTVCKLGTGFDDATLASMMERFAPLVMDKPDKRVVSNITSDINFEPSVVMEVAGAEVSLSPIHTCALGVLKDKTGMAVRFPRFTGRWREDKSAQEATTSDEVVQMYKLQLKRVG